MSIQLKKILKFIAIGLASLVLIVFLIIAIALNFVLTSEKITPKVVQALNQNLKAELKVEEIELSFFKTFPSFTLEVSEGAIVNHLDDSIRSTHFVRRDSLLQFDRCQITVNPWAFLKNKIVVNHLILEKPQINAFIGEKGDVNWDIMKDQDSILIETETTEEASEFKAKIDIRDLKIENGNLSFENELTGVHFGLKDLDVKLKAKYANKNLLMDMDAASPSFRLFKKGDTILNDLALGVKSNFELDRQAKAMHTENTNLRLNDAVFEIKGDVSIQNGKNTLGLDLVFGLENASLENLLGLVPPSVIDKKRIPSSTGEIRLKGKINGEYGKEVYPEIDVLLGIKDGSLSFEGMPHQFDKLQGDMRLLIDPVKHENSFFQLDNFLVKGVNTSIDLNVHIADLINNSRMEANLNGKVDFDALQKTIPFRKGIELKGVLNSAVEIFLTKEDIQRANYGNILGKGHFSVEGFQVKNSIKNNLLNTSFGKVQFAQKDDSEKLSNSGTKVRSGRIELKDLEIRQNSRFRLSSERINLDYRAVPQKDSLSIRRVKSVLEIKDVKLKMGDTLGATLTSAGGELLIGPSKTNPMKPFVETKMQIDSAGFKSKNNYFGILKGNYQVSTEKNEKNLWPLDGVIAFERLVLFASAFPMQVKMPETRIKLSEGVINLENAQLKLGRSDLKATGKLYNFGGRFFRDETMKGELSIYSKFLDLNQIIKTLNAGEKNEESEEVNPDTKLVTVSDVETADSSAVFVVPKGVEFLWNTNLEEVKLAKLTMRKLRGKVTLKDQKVVMQSLSMNTNGAKMFTSSTYEAKSKQKANLEMDFKLVDIELGNLIDLFPVLDSIMPMADSFDGNVNFRMKGRAVMDAGLGMSANQLELIARILGKNMVIMDSETFRKMAKMLFFKDKERNVIDEMSFALQYKDQELEVFPSEFQIDRYRVAVGGVQRLNGNYSFHVSVLKTPVPLVKMGIDVTGTADGNDFDLTGAKYKYFFSKKNKRRAKADQDLMARKEGVIKRLPF